MICITYLYRYFLKVNHPEIILRFHPCCHGASFQFLFLCGVVGDSEAFAVCDEFAHEFVYPKSEDHRRNTCFFHKEIHTRNVVVIVVFKETTREVFQVMDIQFESQKRTCSDDNKEIFGIKAADEDDRFRVVCLNIGRSM